MDDSYRLKVLKALTAHLELIVHVDGDPDNDYGGFDLSAAVFRGRTTYGEESPKTMVSILEAPRPDNGQTAGTNGEARQEQWQLLVQGWCPDDTEHPTDPLYQMMHVVERQMQKIIATNNHTGAPYDPVAYMLGRKVSGFSFGPGVVRPPTEGVSGKAFFYLPCRVGLAKDVA